MTAPDNQELAFLDLFCGCGGFTLGMQRAGFKCLGAIDLDPQAVATFERNLGGETRVFHEDLTRFSPRMLAAALGVESVDVIVGGPPCQGFSTARQVDGANHGRRLTNDPRRNLYKQFLRHVRFFAPRVFVMENVLGFRSAAGGEYFTRVQKEARALGYRVHSQIEDAWELGVPQKRRRQLIVGVRCDIEEYFIPSLEAPRRARPHTPLGAAICDLPILRAGGGEDEQPYDLRRRRKHLLKTGFTARNYLFQVLEVHRADELTNHTARPHSPRDLRDFARLREGENSATAFRKRGVEFEFPYDRSHFKDRYTRQSRAAPCSTIVAHLNRDGLMFIHPTQNRSLTPREAARVQSFPDWFRFPKERTHAFRLIGNAVPPLVAEAVGVAVLGFLQACNTRALQETRPKRTNGTARPRNQCDDVPHLTLFDDETAAESLRRVAFLKGRHLRVLPTVDFLRGWYGLLILFRELHPDNSIEHGKSVERVPPLSIGRPELKKMSIIRYTRTGWPVALEHVGREAWRRVKSGEIQRDMLYRPAMTIKALSRQEFELK